MKAKIETWIRNIESGMIKTNTDRILYEIYKASRSNNEMSQTLFDDFKPGKISTDQLRQRLDIKHQTLTAILSALQDEGLIKVVGQYDDGKSVYSEWAYVSNKTERSILADQRKNEKFAQWTERGLTEFWDMLPLVVKINLKQMKETKK